MTTKDQLAAFRATFSDFKLVKTRKVVQLVFEVPLERANEVLEVLGGMPNPAAEVWCAIARLNNEAEMQEHQDRQEQLPFSKQIRALCKETEFWRFLEARYKLVPPIKDEFAASEIVRSALGVRFRSEIPSDSPLCRDLLSDFRAYQRDPSYAAALEDAE